MNGVTAEYYAMQWPPSQQIFPKTIKNTNRDDGLKNGVVLLFGAVPLRFLTLFASDLPQRTVHRIWAWSLSSDGPAFQESIASIALL